MQVRFLIGPAGSGKTWRFLNEAREELERAPEGRPLIFLAPKQATFQLERQLLGLLVAPGYTRLRILSFERLSGFIFEQLHLPEPAVLDDQGRTMVIRRLIEETAPRLRLFHASARLPGFARELSDTFAELKQWGIRGGDLSALAAERWAHESLTAKFQDIALLAQAYEQWLERKGLMDAGDWLPAATAALSRAGDSLLFGEIWVDGFAHFTLSERQILAALARRADRLSLGWCLDPEDRPGKHSHWTPVSSALQQCEKDFKAVPGCLIERESLPRGERLARFSQCPELRHLEQRWSAVSAWPGNSPAPGVEMFPCPTREAEVELAARKIAEFARSGGRYRQAAVLVRNLEDYHDAVQRVFPAYKIPCFLDRREPVSHHPLADLTRALLRLCAGEWQDELWHTILKSGLLPLSEAELDHLENLALANGWSGREWLEGFPTTDNAGLDAECEAQRRKIFVPLLEFQTALRFRPQMRVGSGGARSRGQSDLLELELEATGAELARAIDRLWQSLRVTDKIEALARGGDPRAAQIHGGCLEKMWQWLDNIELAFGSESFTAQEWAAIVESGLSDLTIGLIPPLLDQVLVGAVDRSRNPDLKQLYLLGLNETVFPASPKEAALINDRDRELLLERGCQIGITSSQRANLENFYGYIACTRARERLTVTYALQDNSGTKLNPSPFVAKLKHLFPHLSEPVAPKAIGWADLQSDQEALQLLLQPGSSMLVPAPVVEVLKSIPRIAEAYERVSAVQAAPAEERLSPALAAQLYGTVLKTSISRLEQFAACPFRFFVHSGLDARERDFFEFEIREKGDFQHKVLEAFHRELEKEGKKWRDLTAAEASQRVSRAAHRLIEENPLFRHSPATRFAATGYIRPLQRFVSVTCEWFRQNSFDPAFVELSFGFEENQLPWSFQLPNGSSVILRGRIDRVDLWIDPSTKTGYFYVVDYKSSSRKLEALFLQHGIQQQLPAYLLALTQIQELAKSLGLERFAPVGMFYVNLRGALKPPADRLEAFEDPASALRRSYRHEGVFVQDFIKQLDSREAAKGDQFPYMVTKKGGFSRVRPDSGPQSRQAFQEMLARTENKMKSLLTRLLDGEAQVHPFRKGKSITACDHCLYQSICRFDPWVQSYNTLQK